MHSCKSVPIEQHFSNKKIAKDIFDALVKEVNANVGPCKIVSLPCCVHLFGTYDFLAALPKKDSLEIRFGLNRTIDSPLTIQTVPLSKNSHKNCLELKAKSQITPELIGWLKESYYIK